MPAYKKGGDNVIDLDNDEGDYDDGFHFYTRNFISRSSSSSTFAFLDRTTKTITNDNIES